MLNVGRIDYANCTPIFSALCELSSGDDYHFTTGVPSQLNAMLAAGELDACPSSSFEYARHPERYLILPQVSISSCGPVASVLLLSRVPVEQLDGHRVLLSSESATSVNLLRILLVKRYGCSCLYAPTELSCVEALNGASALLLIGDAALRASLQRPDVHIYDLGELWHTWTGLPFVFALWLCTRHAVAESGNEVSLLSRQLIMAKELSRTMMEALSEQAPESGWMGKKRLLEYWRENISYDLGSDHLSGLALFFRYCAELGLLPYEPGLHFLHDQLTEV